MEDGDAAHDPDPGGDTGVEADPWSDTGVEADAGSDVPSEWTFWDGDIPDLPLFDKDTHVASCVRTRTCSSHPGQLGTCTASFANITGREIGITLGWVAGCVASASPDCNSITDCLTNGEGPTACEPLVTPDRCEGTVFRQCSRFSGVDLVVDCANIGLSCFLDAEGTAVCGLGACDASTFRSDCHGDTLVACQMGVIVLAQCDAAGLRCVRDLPMPGTCAGGGAPCTEASDPRACDGDLIVGCIDGSIASVDCNAVVERWTCGDRGGVAGCVPSGSECTADPLFGTSVDESCSGDTVTFCMDGWITDLACSDYGMGPCTDLGTAARCTPP